MKKSTMIYRVAFTFGILCLPIIIIIDRESLRNLWIVAPLFGAMFILFGLTFYAIRLEEQGE